MRRTLLDGDLRELPLARERKDARNDYAEEWTRVTTRDKELSRVGEFVMDWSQSGYGINDSNWMQSHAPDPFGYL